LAGVATAVRAAFFVSHTIGVTAAFLHAYPNSITLNNGAETWLLKWFYGFTMNSCIPRNTVAGVCIVSVDSVDTSSTIETSSNLAIVDIDLTMSSCISRSTVTSVHVVAIETSSTILASNIRAIVEN
jgi:hypothetical protein